MTSTWQFSLAHVLIVMTVTAVLAMFARNNVFLADGRATNIMVAFCCVALAVASSVLWSFSWNWVFRFASVIGIAVLLGEVAAAIIFGQISGFGMSAFNILHAIFLIQAIVLSLWLGVGPILPPRVDSDEIINEAPGVQS